MESINSLVLNLLYGPALTSIHDYWRSHSFDPFNPIIAIPILVPKPGKGITHILYHEIKRCLLLGRKTMTNLDSVLKNKDITLPTKVCIVKALVFSVVMHGCERWTIKKAER